MRGIHRHLNHATTRTPHVLTPSLPLTAQAIQALVARFSQSSRVLRLF